MTTTSIVRVLWIYTWGLGTNILLSASQFDNKNGLKAKKTCHLIVFRSIFYANAQLTHILTTKSIVPAVWIYTLGLGTIILLSALRFDNKNGSKKPRKTCNFISYPLIFFMLTLSILKFCQPHQLYQPCRLRHEF